jgi:hypothetical protein
MKSPLPGRGRAPFPFALCLPLLTAACVFFAEDDSTGGKAVQGGGSDSETLTGLVSSPDGFPAVAALVKLIPATYDPSNPDPALIRRTVTDDSGAFRFEKLDSTATYNLIAGKAGDKSWAFAGAQKPGPGRRPLALSRAKVFLFSMHAEDYQTRDSGVAYFPGTDILTRCDGVSSSKVDSVPLGALRFVVASRAGWVRDTTLAAAADTTRVSASKNRLTLFP